MGPFLSLSVMGKARYSKEADNPEKSCRAKGSYLRVHFKNTYEVAMAIKGMNLRKAQRYLNDVIDKKQAIAFRVFNGGPGRHAQGKNLKAPGGQVRWPQKSCRFVLDLLRNAEVTLMLRDFLLKLLKLLTFKSIEHLNKEDAVTELMVVSTLTCLLHPTLK